jgi:hypothetical protein
MVMMRRPGSLFLLLGALLLAGCGTPNMPVARGVDIGGHALESDARKVDDIATGLGFVKVPNYFPPNHVLETATEDIQELEHWEFTKRPTLAIDLSRWLFSDRYHVSFTDYRMGAPDMVGETCTKYLEFVAAMKAEFGADRLVFNKESCKYWPDR